MNNSSRLDLIKSLPYDLQIEIVENEFRKSWTESEKADIAIILKKQLEKCKKLASKLEQEHQKESVNSN